MHAHYKLVLLLKIVYKFSNKTQNRRKIDYSE